ncbi:hypothetical protein A244_39853 [Pseudomonas syringae pv. actinidiae ICMP 18807]|uniref:Uncharacterized protein n=1 Tax=Pseudomonas syringae pv. actinidiae ICMP 18807 TaxID=1194404 RepID=S6SF34_PSESF|nr:hypothetical protein [Pseudomonas syringae]EPN29760.1 hypothetical protein A244_39853 [Pseudomonas syringae pv. actinidiae ICMP 18807]
MHQDITLPNVIDEAVEFVRDHFRLDRGLNIRQAHAHAAVSHFLGYNSKIALKSDTYFDPCDADLINYCKTGVEKLAEHIPRMKQTPLQDLNLDELHDVIRAGLAPACENCGHKCLSITPLGYQESEPDGWVCNSCVARYDAEYEHCRFCGDGYVYRASDINEHGECSAHDGESVLDDEETEDYESLAEYYLNHD